MDENATWRLGGPLRRAWTWGAGLSLLLAATLAQAQGVSWEQGLRSDAPDRYTVVRGDTLWDISGRFLRHPWQWPEVWQVNPQIRNPHLIYPGDVITLQDCHGRPCLGIERGQGEVRLSPEVRRVPVREAIEPIPLDTVRHFLRDHRVIDDPEALDELAYVVAGNDRRIISGAGDRIYARGELQRGQRYGIYRVGERYHDAATGELLGLELIGIGRARAERSEDGIALMEVLAASQEVRNEDIVLPLEARELASEFMPRAPDHEVDGTILAVPGGVRFIGRLQVVALDRGRRDGLETGHVLQVEQQGERVVDPRTGESLRLPGTDAGLVMVFRPYERMSYGLVMRATRTLEVGDRLHNPRRGVGVAQR
ncbi:LysM peptidoglycan-binding domain-containing protein [Halomonas sp. MCCC 1A17488]|uniref:LysM peptidoglycan-binding domain-containing protein n=1 Tax=Billgrantia sulfidoxydans TaxID=2733484 RepID=A0ABX7W8E4_9GAMM|nr:MULTISPECIES: LysM domain-containing protein [Halomonas]MCE8017840.1 LysM peptidoglycan-binding domain-containing protein [Halomonas sp. MCCC 1A17488]MCG3241173.1 LysM peptidoglycan-binding domain-containing protein [Halomonas sp. MCCC 1A17488]QPP49023.1 LysM peptidoglycan-binding domain-containing protein [Halomonas sp. SS10-MC5]QTP56360.1 LysM peptidoglycan-binding domain-containing protein [Halomonas sulfidoxydans]